MPTEQINPKLYIYKKSVANKSFFYLEYKHVRKKFELFEIANQRQAVFIQNRVQEC